MLVNTANTSVGTRATVMTIILLMIIPHTAVDRVLPSISTYLRDMLKKEKLSPEAEALRARYDSVLMSLEKISASELLPPPAQRSTVLRKSVGDSPGLPPVNRSRGENNECCCQFTCTISSRKLSISAPTLLGGLYFKEIILNSGLVINYICTCTCSCEIARVVISGGGSGSGSTLRGGW